MLKILTHIYILFQKMMAEKMNYLNNVKPIHSALFLESKIVTS